MYSLSGPELKLAPGMEVSPVNKKSIPLVEEVFLLARNPCNNGTRLGFVGRDVFPEKFPMAKVLDIMLPYIMQTWKNILNKAQKIVRCKPLAT